MFSKITYFFDKYSVVLFIAAYLFFLLSAICSLYYLGVICVYLDVFDNPDLTELLYETFGFGFLSSICLILGIDVFTYIGNLLGKGFNRIKASRKAFSGRR